jgi:hypothetical protein
MGIPRPGIEPPIPDPGASAGMRASLNSSSQNSSSQSSSANSEGYCCIPFNSDACRREVTKQECQGAVSQTGVVFEESMFKSGNGAEQACYQAERENNCAPPPDETGYCCTIATDPGGAINQGGNMCVQQVTRQQCADAVGTDKVGERFFAGDTQDAANRCNAKLANNCASKPYYCVYNKTSARMNIECTNEPIRDQDGTMIRPPFVNPNSDNRHRDPGDLAFLGVDGDPSFETAAACAEYCVPILCAIEFNRCDIRSVWDCPEGYILPYGDRTVDGKCLSDSRREYEQDQNLLQQINR